MMDVFAPAVNVLVSSTMTTLMKTTFRVAFRVGGSNYGFLGYFGSIHHAPPSPHLSLTLATVGTYIIGTEGGTQEKTRQTLTPCCLAKNEIQYIFKEVIMKRLIFYLILVFGLAQFSYLGAQDVEEELVYLGRITDMPVVASTPGAVVAMGVYIGDSAGTASYLIDYAAGQTWYMYICCINWASSTKSFKLEYDLRYGDGYGYRVYRASASLSGGNWGIWRLNVTSYVAKLGLFTLTGRVYGTGMGNDNKVTSQVVAY
jgi:hypothetical protein